MPTGKVQDLRMDVERRRIEEALRASERRARDLFESIPIGIYRTTPDGRVLLANPALLRMLGFDSFAEYAARNLEQEFLASYPRKLFKERLERDGVIRGLEAIWQRRDGTTVFVRENARAVRDHTGHMLYYEGTVEDITERKQAEEKLAASEKQLAEAQKIAHLGSWEWDVAADRVTWSDELFRIFGLRPQEFGTTYEAFLNCIHPDDREQVCKMIGQAFSDHQPFNFYHRSMRPDGTVRIVHGRGEAVMDDAGRLARMIGTAQDITEHKQAEEALLRSQTRLRLLNSISTAIRADMSVAQIIACAVTQTQQYFPSFRVAYSTIDERNRLTVNHAIEPAGLPPLTGLTIDLTSAPDYLAALRRNAAVVVADVNQDARLAPLQEKLRVNSTAAMLNVPVRHSDKLIGLFCCDAPTAHSWTEHERETVKEVAAYLSVVIREAHAEQERQRSELERAELLRRLVTVQEKERRRIALELHDQLGQDITALMLGLKALQDFGALPADDERLLQLMRLTDQLGCEAHRIAWELRPSALDDLGLHVTLRNYLEEGAKRFDFTVDFHSNGLADRRLPPPVETAVYRIVQEALTNVSKHAQAQHVSVLLEYRQGRLLVIVEDDGRGFDTDEVLRAANTERRMGLIGMHERVRLVGGELEIESAPGAGTTVYVRVPISR